MFFFQPNKREKRVEKTREKIMPFYFLLNVNSDVIKNNPNNIYYTLYYYYYYYY